MSELRRRIFGAGTPDSTPSVSRDSSPAPAGRGGESYKVIPREKLEKLTHRVKHSGRRRRNAWVFLLGGLVGILAAGFFASNSDGLTNLADLVGLTDMNLDSILDVLPAGLIREVRDLQVSSYHHICLLIRKLIVDEGVCPRSHMRKMPSTTTPSPLACRPDPKASKLSIP